MQMDLQFKAAEHQQTMAQEQQKFEMQMAQNEAKARQQMVADARKDAQENKGCRLIMWTSVSPSRNLSWLVVGCCAT